MQRNARARRGLTQVLLLLGAWWLGLGSLAAPACGEAAPAIAERVVSLNPSLTAILLALGARDALVGADEFSVRTQPELAELPTVGGLYNPSLEGVLALHPDLVVLVTSAEQRDFRERLAALDVPVLALAPVGFDEVVATIETLGRRVGRGAAAAQRAREIRAAREEVERVTASLPRARVVLVLQREPLFVVGAGSFIDEMLRAAGAENLGAQFPETYPRVALEWLVATAPAVILDAAPDSEPAARYWARWPSIPAVESQRVIAVPAGLVTLPGPELDRALRTLAQAIHGLGPAQLSGPAR